MLAASLHSLQLDEEFRKQMLMIDLDVTVIKLAHDELLLGKFSKIDVESKYESYGQSLYDKCKTKQLGCLNLFGMLSLWRGIAI